MAMPSPASDNMEIDFAIMAGISTFHLQGTTPQHSTTINQNGKGKRNKNEWYQQQNVKISLPE